MNKMKINEIKINENISILASYKDLFCIFKIYILLFILMKTNANLKSQRN